MSTADPVTTHYGRGGLAEAMSAALTAAGIDPEHPGPDDLAPLEEFHTLGRPASLALAELAGVQEGMRVLDVGAGVGGPARLLEEAGFALDSVEDLTATAREWMRQLASGGGASPSGLGLHLLVADLPRKLATFLRNLEEDRAGLLRVVARRP